MTWCSYLRSLPWFTSSFHPFLFSVISVSSLFYAFLSNISFSSSILSPFHSPFIPPSWHPSYSIFFQSYHSTHSSFFLLTLLLFLHSPTSLPFSSHLCYSRLLPIFSSPFSSRDSPLLLSVLSSSFHSSFLPSYTVSSSSSLTVPSLFSLPQGAASGYTELVPLRASDTRVYLLEGASSSLSTCRHYHHHHLPPSLPLSPSPAPSL